MGVVEMFIGWFEGKRFFGGFVGFRGVEKVRGSEKFEREERGLGSMDRPLEVGGAGCSSDT